MQRKPLENKSIYINNITMTIIIIWQHRCILFFPKQPFTYPIELNIFKMITTSTVYLQHLKVYLLHLWCIWVHSKQKGVECNDVCLTFIQNSMHFFPFFPFRLLCTLVHRGEHCCCNVPNVFLFICVYLHSSYGIIEFSTTILVVFAAALCFICFYILFFLILNT